MDLQDQLKNLFPEHTPEDIPKENIEKHSNVNININSKNGEITFNEQQIDDPLMIFKIENVIRAMRPTIAK